MPERISDGEPGPTGWATLKALLWFVVSPLTVALLFVVAIGSVPYGLIVHFLDRRAERRFVRRMEGAGRFMGWSDFQRVVAEERGTVIREELRQFQGPVRWWWTPDDIDAIVAPPPDHELAPWQGEGWREYCLWCCDRYTDPSAGSALLVWSSGLPKEDRTVEEDELEIGLPLVKVARLAGSVGGVVGASN